MDSIPKYYNSTSYLREYKSLLRVIWVISLWQKTSVLWQSWNNQHITVWCIPVSVDGEISCLSCNFDLMQEIWYTYLSKNPSFSPDISRHNDSVCTISKSLIIKLGIVRLPKLDSWLACSFARPALLMTGLVVLPEVRPGWRKNQAADGQVIDKSW